jgi:hypothetical protein
MDARNRDLKKEIKEERLKKRSDPMWFYDEAEESWEAFRRTALPLEREHLEIRRVLRDAQAALRADPRNDYLQARVKYLEKRLQELEKQAPWLAADAPVEVLLWGVPHG